MSPEIKAQRAVDVLDSELSALGSPISRHAAENIVIRIFGIWNEAEPEAEKPPEPRTIFTEFDHECVPGN